MVCVYCGGSTQVNNSRAQLRSNQIWRRRQCKDCRAVFTTLEAIDLPSTELSVDSKGHSEPFLPDKLFAELVLTFKGYGNVYLNAREITNTVMRELLKQPRGASINSRHISQTVAKVLKRFDRQAYLRYVAEHPSLQS